MQLAARRAVVVSLRLQGGSFRDIAQQLLMLPEEDRARYGVTESYCEVHAYRDCMAELKRLNKQAQEGIGEVKRLELERLDALLASWWERAQADPIAFDKVLTVMGQRARYLGLNAPEQNQSQNINVDVTQLTNEQLERIISGENPLSVLAATRPSRT